jgi:hypothetical protein
VSGGGDGADRRNSKGGTSTGTSGGDVTKMDDEELMDFLMDDENFA